MSVKTWVAVYDVAIRYAGVERPVERLGLFFGQTKRYALEPRPGLECRGVPVPTPWRVALRAPHLIREASSCSHSTCGTSNCPRFGATSHAADKPYKVTEKRPQLFGRDTPLPRQPMALCMGVQGTPSGTPTTDRPTINGQRVGAVDHDGVSNTIHYLINDRDRLLARHCLRKFSWCARDCHSLVASSIQTIGMRLISPAIRRRDVPTPHPRRVALRAPRTRTLGRLLARRTRRTGDDVLIMQVLRREGRPCAGMLPRRHRKMRGSGRQSLLMLRLLEEQKTARRGPSSLRPRPSSPR